MKIRLIALTLVAAFALALPATASADDRGVYTAWSKEDARGKKLHQRFNRAFKRYKASDTRVWKPIYRASRAIAKYGADTQAAVKAQSASTPEGENVRAIALKALRFDRASYTNLARGIRLAARGRRRAAGKALNRAVRQERTALRLIRRANRGFKELGFG
jgi:hypothetical protein